MDLEAFERLPAAAVMRLAEVAMVAAARPEHSKEALMLAEAASKVLIGPRMDMLVASVMWMAGERTAGLEVLERTADDPEMGAAAQAMLAMFLAVDGRASWKSWARKADGSTDPLHREMLKAANEIAMGTPPGDAASPAEPLAADLPVAKRHPVWQGLAA